MDPGFESVDLSCTVGVCMALRRSELMDGGGDGRFDCVGRSCAAVDVKCLRTCFIRVRLMFQVISFVFVRRCDIGVVAVVNEIWIYG